jgi:hypothetical protein
MQVAGKYQINGIFFRMFGVPKTLEKLGPYPTHLS